MAPAVPLATYRGGVAYSLPQAASFRWGSLRSNETVSILPQRRQQNVRSVCLRAVLVAIKSITTPQRPHRGVSLSFVS